MDKINRKLLILTEDKDKFYSLLSIGDIQRAIIKDISLDSPVKNIIRDFIRIAGINDTKESIRKMIFDYRMEFVPVVDEEKKIINVFFWEDFFGNDIKRNKSGVNIPVVIMAGGIGTRMKPITNVIPKPLISIGDDTIIEIIMKKFANSGVKDFFVSVNYKKELIKYYFENKEFDFNINFFDEDKPLGTIGSLSLIEDKINDRFFVTNCDIIVNQDYKELVDYHISNDNMLTLVGVFETDRIPYGVIEKDNQGNVVKINEKPNLSYIVNSGMYILERQALEYIPKNEFYNITDLMEKLISENKKVGYFPVSENSWFDIGEWDKYQNTLKMYGESGNIFL